MAKQKKPAQERQVMTGLDRLGLRVSSMINHPVAQLQRWVIIHRLDTDGDAEWEKVMSLLLEAPELDLKFNANESVTVRWDAQGVEEYDDLTACKDREEKTGEKAPF